MFDQSIPKVATNFIIADHWEVVTSKFTSIIVIAEYEDVYIDIVVKVFFCFGVSFVSVSQTQNVLSSIYIIGETSQIGNCFRGSDLNFEVGGV